MNAGLLSQLDQLIDQRTLTSEEFIDLMFRLGFNTGAPIAIHASMDEITRRVPGMTPATLIKLMQQMVGEEGTLLMHLKADALGHTFRRMRGVHYRIYAAQAVAGWGRWAQELVDAYPVLFKLREVNGLVVGLGAGLAGAFRVARNYNRIERILLREGTFRCISQSGLRCIAADADRFVSRAIDLVNEGNYI